MAGSKNRLRAIWLRAGLLCALTATPAMAAGPAAVPVIGSAKPTEASQSLESYRADVARMQALVAACEGRSSACDPHQVARDAQVGDVAHGGFDVHWEWLRDALADVNHAKPDARAKLLQDCAARLQAMAQESGATPDAQADADARAKADAVLRRPEFQSNGEPTWWERKKAQWLGWLMRLFDGLSEFGSNRPLLAPILEWLLFGGAAVGLVVFLIRVAARQRRRVALSAGAVQAVAWDREATDWAQMAAACASREEWREAVHCLYWSAIVLLESRRAWRHNPSRTPREYVRLLRPGSAQQQGLRGLTQIFERVWYGFGEADRARYERALAEYERLAAGGEGTTAVSGLSAEVA